MSNFQLYHSSMSIELPWAVRYSRKKDEATLIKKNLDNQVYTFWPNGAPCTLVNIWLQEITIKSTGDSAETFASHITHLIRFCHKTKRSLLSIDDDFLLKFSKHLQEEKILRHAALSTRRNPNHVRYTIRRVLDFLIWYQMNYHLFSQQKIIGELGTGARVTIEWRIGHDGRALMHHPAIPTKRPPVGDKKPMPDDFIGKIYQTIEILRTQSKDDKNSTNSRKAALATAKSTYLYSRRIVTLKLMRLTGLRPGELNAIPLHLNYTPIDDRTIRIPTLKTREKIPPIREFRLSLEDAIDLTIYIQARRDFLAHLNLSDLTCPYFLLGLTGNLIETRSIARDFRRICELSGLINVQACLSMFRHRFITTQIAYEICRELKRDISQKDLWQEAVQRSILSKVAKLTGHKKPMSLKSYYNDAYANAISQTFNKSPDQSLSLIVALQCSINKLSKLPTAFSDINIVREISQMEKTLSELKSIASDP